MKFFLSEFDICRTMCVGDTVDLMAKTGKIPDGVLEELKSHVKRHDSIKFGKVLFEDGREFWTITFQTFSKKVPKIYVKRTSVFFPNGNIAFKGKRSARGTISSMEGRRESRILKFVMGS